MVFWSSKPSSSSSPPVFVKVTEPDVSTLRRPGLFVDDVVDRSNPDVLRVFGGRLRISKREATKAATVRDLNDVHKS